MPDNADPKPRTQADKDRSRQQSRAVSGRQAARATTGAKPAAKGPQKGGSNQNRAKAGGPPNKGGRPKAGGSRPVAAPRRASMPLLTWGIVGLVIVIVLVFVGVKVFGGSTPASVSSAFQPLPASVATDITTVPTSVFNAVGTTSPAVSITPPTVIKGKAAYVVDGKPGFYYYGAEYCPYCAAERWAISATLARFGSLSGLGAMTSSSTDVFPSTQTVTFAKAAYSSPYIGASLDEYYTNVPLASGGYSVLKKPTAAEQKLISTYDSSTYFSGLTPGETYFPFIDIDNKVLVVSASYSPSLLQGLSRAQIAAGLSDAKSPVTEAILATSNYLSASICSADGGMPKAVCGSKGVTDAAKAMKLS
jgi:hypothetical protein